MHSVPFWRLSGFYFSFFAVLGTLMPYWTLYLKHDGFSSLEISQIMMIPPLVRVIAPNLWGWLSDKSSSRILFVRIGVLLAGVSFAFVLLKPNLIWLGIILLVHNFFWTAVLPQFDLITLHHLKENPNSYSKIRLWGSIGFICSVSGIGWALDYISVSWVPTILLALFSMVWLNSLIVPERVIIKVKHTHDSFINLLKKPPVPAFLVCCFLMQLSHGPYYTFYSILLQEHQYSHKAVGVLWSVGVVAEIVIFLLMPQLMDRFGPRKIFLASFALASLRWWAIGSFANSVWVIGFAQLLHAASFGSFFAVAIYWTYRFFDGAHAGQGQALMNAVSYGLGGVLGAYLSGQLWTFLGPNQTFFSASIATSLAFIISYRFITPAE